MYVSIYIYIENGVCVCVCVFSRTARRTICVFVWCVRVVLISEHALFRRGHPSTEHDSGRSAAAAGRINPLEAESMSVRRSCAAA